MLRSASIALSISERFLAHDFLAGQLNSQCRCFHVPIHRTSPPTYHVGAKRGLATIAKRKSAASGAAFDRFGPGGRSSDILKKREGLRSRKKVKSKASCKPGQERNPRRLLEPHILSARLKKLCDEGQIDLAVSTLKNSPLAAQNAPVWNTLIWECMKAKRFRLAYELFTDMKRRGFSPTTRTYQTMFTGLSRIELWPTHPKQLTNAHSLYSYFLKHLASLKQYEPESKELTIRPLNFYVKILGDAGDFERLFTVYYTLLRDDSSDIDQYFYTAMFEAIAKQKAPTNEDGIQNVLNPKVLWEQMLKVSERSSTFVIDSHLVVSALKALAKGTLSDQKFALTIVRKYLGLTTPEEKPEAPSQHLTTHTLEAALTLCITMREYRLCIHYLQQVHRRRPRTGEEPIIDRHHMEHLLRAYESLAFEGATGMAQEALKSLQWMLRMEISGPHGPKIRPGMSTFLLVLKTCWRSADWQCATETFRLMTGYHSQDFADMAGAKKWQRPKYDQRSPGRNLIPDAEAMSCMVRAALASRDPGNMRQCLRMINYLGIDSLLGDPHPPTKSMSSPSKQLEKNRIFYQIKLAEALSEAVDRVLENGKGTESQSEWLSLKQAAEEVLQRPRGLIRIPDATFAAQPSDLHEEFIGFEAAREATSRQSRRRSLEWLT